MYEMLPESDILLSFRIRFTYSIFESEIEFLYRNPYNRFQFLTKILQISKEKINFGSVEARFLYMIIFLYYKF